MDIFERATSEQAGYQDSTVTSWTFRSENYYRQKKKVWIKKSVLFQ